VVGLGISEPPTVAPENGSLESLSQRRLQQLETPSTADKAKENFKTEKLGCPMEVSN